MYIYNVYICVYILKVYLLYYLFMYYYIKKLICKNLYIIYMQKENFQKKRI